VFVGTRIFPEYKTSEDVIFNDNTPVGVDSNGREYGYVHSGLEEHYKEKGF
jgi:hypothetical protein